MGLERIGRWASLPLSLLLGAGACGTSATTGARCRLGDPRPRPAAAVPAGATAAAAASPPLLDLADLHLFRNYLAVTAVGPVGHHFAVSYDHVEGNVAHLRAELDASGGLHVDVVRSWWGGLAGHVSGRAPPPEVADLARRLEDELPRRCPGGRRWSLAYTGEYREIEVRELIAHHLDGVAPRATGAGWIARRTLKADRGLDRIVGTIESMSGFGRAEIPARSQWVPLDPALAGGRALASGRLGAGGELDALVLAAARRAADGAESPSLAALPIPAPQSLLAPGYDARVDATIHLRGRGQGGAGDRNGPPEVRLSFDLHEAVFGAGAEARGGTYVAGTRVTVSARLAAPFPRAPSPARVSEPFEGALSVSMEDGDGNRWERVYPARGPILRQDDQVVAPVGLELPGKSAPSPEYDALAGSLPGGSKHRGIDFRLDVALHADPRRGRN